MSQISLGKEDLLRNFSPETILSDIIRHYEESFTQSGEVICRVRLNQMPLSEDQERQYAQMQLAEISNLEIETENPKTLMMEVVHDWMTGLPEVIKLTDSLSGRIRLHGFDSQVSSFTHLLDACHFLVTSLESVRIMLLAQQQTPSEQWVSLEKKLNTTFTQIMDACQNKDGGLIADLLEYELASILQEWVQFLPRIQAQIGT